MRKKPNDEWYNLIQKSNLRNRKKSTTNLARKKNVARSRMRKKENEEENLRVTETENGYLDFGKGMWSAVYATLYIGRVSEK